MIIYRNFEENENNLSLKMTSLKKNSDKNLRKSLKIIKKEEDFSSKSLKNLVSFSSSQKIQKASNNTQKNYKKQKKSKKKED